MQQQSSLFSERNCIDELHSTCPLTSGIAPILVALLVAVFFVKTSSAEEWICATKEIPPGKVAIAAAKIAECDDPANQSNDSFNAFQLGEPQNGINICV